MEVLEVIRKLKNKLPFYRKKGIILTMLDSSEILSFFRDSLGKFSDRSAKWLLSNPENLRGFLEIIGDDFVASLDFSSIQRVNTTFIADNLREQESDMVFLLPFRDTDETEVMIYILIEHQSTVDPVMGFRLLFYMCQVWDQQRQQWVSENMPKRAWRFRPIIPVVFYTGSSEWQTLPSLETLMDVPQVLTRFIPRFETLFLGVKSESDASLLRGDNAFGWLMTVLKHEDVTDSSVFVSALERLGNHLGSLNEEDRVSWKQAIYYLYLLVFYKRSVEERGVLEEIMSDHYKALNLSDQEVEVMQSMAEHYLQQGIEQGARQMSIENTLVTLTTRFPNVDVNALKPTLEAVEDLNRLKQLNLTAAIAETFRDFREHLDA